MINLFNYPNKKSNGKNKLINMNNHFRNSLSIRNESILDEKYIEIQNTATNHLTTLQNVVTVLKNKRKDVKLSIFFSSI